MGIKNSKTIHPTLTLADLGMDSLMSVEIKQALERDYDVILSMSEIRALTFQQLREINDGNVGILRDEKAKQIELSIPMITVPSQLTIQLNEVTQGKPIFFLPPIEGVFDLVIPLTKHMSRPVIGLQYNTECKPYKTISELAAFYLKECRKHQQDDTGYDLIGYSFGSVVAFEMSLQAKCTTLILLDGSPYATKRAIEKYRVKLDAVSAEDKRIEASILFISQFVPIDLGKTKDELKSITDIDQRNARIAEIYAENGGPSCESNDIVIALDAFLQKIDMLHTYTPNGKVKIDKDVVLVRSDESFLGDEDVPEDYNLSQDVDGNVKVKQLRGNHRAFLNHNLKELASIINDSL